LRKPITSGEPRWPVVVALLAVAALRLGLPASLRVGPDWTMAVVVPLLLVPTIWLHRAGYHKANEIAGYLVTGVLTGDLIASLSLMIARLPAHKESPKELLMAAAGLWVSNTLVFASWYWRLDAGGPNARDRRDGHDSGAFLFPQMMQLDSQPGNWKPGFVDYLFLAFNTSTAFSPTDVPVLSRWAKLMMMVQACISLGTVIILAARAVNVL
jgi:hypothetical protein